MSPPPSKPRRILVSEYVAGGAWPDGIPEGSLAREGAAMLHAVVEDLSTLTGVEVHTTWDGRLGPPPWQPTSHSGSATALTVTVVDGPAEEWQQFAELARQCDAVLVIAPEFDRLLEQRSDWVSSRGIPLLGPSPAAVALCADKWRLAQHFESNGVPTIPTTLCDLAQEPTVEPGWPRVIKPRFGAGSTSTFLLQDRHEQTALGSQLAFEPLLNDAIIQPFRVGIPASVAVICQGDGRVFLPLPLARQRLSSDGRFHYLGGELPFPSPFAPQALELARLACASVPGLRGFVGVDLLVDEVSGQVTIVEINPRLTTSYLGYRRLAAAPSRPGGVILRESPLARALVWPENARASLGFRASSPLFFEPIQGGMADNGPKTGGTTEKVS